MAKDNPTTVLRLARPLDEAGRRIDSVAFAGAPCSEPLPINENDGEFELDVLMLMQVMARRTGLSRPAIERLSPIDLLALSLVMFGPRRGGPQPKKK